MYTTVNFVDDTKKCGVVVHGLPNGMKPEEAADKLKQLNIPLRELPVNESWEHGWFPKEVYTADGKLLATIDMGTLDKMQRNLRLTDVALEYLK